ncbi:MAG: hypothetical protein IIB62_04180, partial [Proteobacteria bacterium]|nr:hypothetical protein [Pseudomonadota bacterium]
MAEIILSSAVRNNLLSLQNTASLLAKTQERLATGLKVNSALDDPTAFFTASSLNSRAGDLSRLLDSVGNAVQTVRAADNGLSSLTKLVETAQANVRQALQKPGAVTTAAQAASITGSTFAADDTGAVATGTGDNFGADTVATAAGSNLGAQTQTLGVNLGFADGDQLTVNIGGTIVIFEFDIANDGVSGGTTELNVGGATDTLVELVGVINTALTAGAATDSDAGGDFALQIAATSAAVDITITGSSASVLTKLGLDAVGTGTATVRTIIPSNSNVNALTETNFGVSVGSGSLQTIDISSIENRRDLLIALNSGSTGVTFDLSGSNIRATADTLDTLSFTNGVAINLADALTTNAALAGLTNSFTVDIGGAGAQTVNLNNVDSVASLLAEVVAAGGAVTNGQISFTASNTTDTIVVAGDVTSTGLSTGTTNPTAATTTDNADRATLETVYNNLRTQIDQLASDASFNGNNLLNGDSLSVIFNSLGTSNLSITGVTFNSAGLGVTAAAADSFQSNTSLN